MRLSHNHFALNVIVTARLHEGLVAVAYHHRKAGTKFHTHTNRWLDLDEVTKPLSLVRLLSPDTAHMELVGYVNQSLVASPYKISDNFLNFHLTSQQLLLPEDQKPE